MKCLHVQLWIYKEVLQKYHKNPVWNNSVPKYLSNADVATTGGTMPFLIRSLNTLKC